MNTKFTRTAVKLLSLSCLATCIASPATAALIGLETAGRYNIFVRDDVKRTNTSVNGRIAAGNLAEFKSVGIGSALSGGLNIETGGALKIDGGSVRGDVIVGGHADLKNPTLRGKLDVRGNVDHSGGGSFSSTVTTDGHFKSSDGATFSGPVHVGKHLEVSGTLSASSGVNVGGHLKTNTPSISGGLRVNGNVDFTGGGGNVSGGFTFGGNYSGPSYITRTRLRDTAILPAPSDVDVDFNSLGSQLIADSQYIANLTPNGSAIRQFSTLTLTGANQDLNIFSLAATDLTNISNFVINTPTGASVVINISGTSVTLGNFGYSLNGQSLSAAADKLLFNAYQANSLTHFSLGGTLLAPNATVDFNNGTFTGTLIANNLNDGNGSFATAAAFTGNIPIASVNNAIPEPTVSCLLLAAAALLRRNRV